MSGIDEAIVKMLLSELKTKGREIPWWYNMDV